MESVEQKEFVKWMRRAHPQLARSLRVSMSGMSWRGRMGAINWNVMKSQGVQPGESDIMIALPVHPYGALVIEHKGEKKGRHVTEDQQEYLDYHNAIGNLAISTRGVEQLIRAVDCYINGDFGDGVFGRQS